MKITKDKLEKLVDGFYLFTTENCPTCEKLKSSLSDISIDVSIVELNAYDNQNLAMEFNLMGTPCMIDYRQGSEYDRMYGAPNTKRITAFLKGE